MKKLTLYVAAIVIMGSFSESLSAARIVLRRPRGPIIPNSNPISNQPFVRRLPGTANLVAINGQIFERDRQGLIRPIFFNRQTGRLVGAREARTAVDLARVLSPFRGRMGGEMGVIVDRFLNGMGVGSPVLAGAGLPNPAAGGSAPQGQRGSSEVLPGNHGNGVNGSTEPRGAARRGPDGSVNSDGTVSAGACRDLNSSICNGAERVANERNIENFKQGIINQFIQGSGIGSRGFAATMANITRAPNQFGRAFGAFMNFLSGSVPNVSGAINDIRRSLVSAIQASPLSEGTKSAMASRIEGLRFRMTPNIGDLESIRSFVESCGPDGMSDGAFALPDRGEVVICPGLLLGALAQKNNGGVSSFLTHVLAHEMGHNIGSDINPETGRAATEFRGEYAKLSGCLQKNFGRHIHPGQHGECTADHWGVAAIAQQIKGKSPGEAFQFVKNSLQPLCGSPASPVHPPGSFRIGIILGRSPEIMSALGCPGPTTESPGCTLEGTVPGGS